MDRNVWRWPRILLVALVLGSGMAATPVPSALADTPGGLQIGNTAVCRIVQGGHGGLRLNYEFKWFYPDTGTYGPAFNVGGTYTLQLHNPFKDTYKTVVSFPYGHSMSYGHVEVRDGEDSSQRTIAADHVRMETTWTIEETGETGVDVAIIPCDVEPPPPGLELVSTGGQNKEKKKAAEDPEGFETFITVADPPPYTALEITTWLFCEEESDQKDANREVIWGIGADNRGVGGVDGVLVAGSIRISVRGPGGAYSVASDEPFGLWVKPGEQFNFQRNLFSKGLAAAKMEIFYRASIGTDVDPNSPERKVYRTTACEL